MLFGAAGQCLSMVILAGCTSPAALQPVGGDPKAEATNDAPAYVAAAFLFIVSLEMSLVVRNSVADYVPFSD